MNDSRVPNRRRVQCEAKNCSKNLKTSERFYQKMGSIIRERRRKKKCVNKYVAVGNKERKMDGESGTEEKRRNTRL